jgi:hypothetical protein
VSTLGRQALRTTLVCLIGLVGAVGAVGLPGCAMGGPQMTPGVQFALEASLSDDEAAPAAKSGIVRVRGYATVPTTVRNLLNVQDGKVSGTPVEVRDALTGKVMAKGVTFYDGSFLVEVPCFGAQRSAIVAIDLVARDDANRTMSLQAPVVVRRGQDDAQVTLTPGSTALMAFFASVATEGASAGGAKQLSDMIASFAPDDQSRFASLAEMSPEISTASTLASFESGIRQYVGRLRGRRAQGAKGADPATLASANGL